MLGNKIVSSDSNVILYSLEGLSKPVVTRCKYFIYYGDITEDHIIINNIKYYNTNLL
jgi:hypothetical protein